MSRKIGSVARRRNIGVKEDKDLGMWGKRMKAVWSRDRWQQ